MTTTNNSTINPATTMMTTSKIDRQLLTIAVAMFVFGIDRWVYSLIFL
jgi:hypothetical protein